MSKPEIFLSTGALYKAAANKVLQLYETAMLEKGRFTIALSGGNTPKKLYELLAEPFYSKKINWRSVFVFWSDERCVPLYDKDNNSHMASEALLDNVDIPKENIFRVPVNFEPSKAALQYEQLIKNFFKNKTPAFDLLLLGIGEDGHTASLFPGTGILDEKKALVKQVYIKEKDSFRITFTVPLINLAKNILFLISGKEKSTILGSIFNKPVKKNSFPAQLIRPATGNLFWYLDKAAASQLKL
ncbi:MAG: 6-phosphogluconolactonase [Ferruginibacter sp.]